MLTLATEGPGVVVSALKMADDRDSVAVRLFSVSSTASRVLLSLEGGVGTASVLNLLEEVQEPIAVAKRHRTVDISGFGLRTAELVPARARPLRVPRYGPSTAGALCPVGSVRPA